MSPRYSTLAFLREGKTDEVFLSKVLLRATERLCSLHAGGLVDFGPLQELMPQDRTMEACKKVAVDCAGRYDILFVHTDGNGDPEKARRERVAPIAQAVRESGHPPCRAVPVVPVRMMEAWALADGDALRHALGCAKSDSEFGLPSPRQNLEKESDPKSLLNHCSAVARGGRRSRRTRGGPSSGFLDRVAEAVSLDSLAKLPSYSRFERDLLGALVDLGIAHAGNAARQTQSMR